MNLEADETTLVIRLTSPLISGWGAPADDPGPVRRESELIGLVSDHVALDHDLFATHEAALGSWPAGD